MPSFYRSMGYGNTAFTFRRGLLKGGRAVVTLQTGFVLVAMLPFRSVGIIPHAATASLAGWPDPPEACLQSHIILSPLFTATWPSCWAISSTLTRSMTYLCPTLKMASS